MKKILLALALIPMISLADPVSPPPPGYCIVKVCNKIERWTLSPWSAIKDKVGETCQISLLPKAESVLDKILNEDSRWYQGSSINPTKKSVTRVKEVRECR